MNRTLQALTLALAISTTPMASAQQLTNESATTEHFTTGYVSSLLTELGAQQVQVQTDPQKNVTFVHAQIPYNVQLGICDKTNANICDAAIMLVIFDAGTNYAVETFNSFNKEQAFVTAVKLENNRFAVTRMIISSGGITKKNVAVNIASFTSAPARLVQHLNSQVVAGYQPPISGQFPLVNYPTTGLRAVVATPNDIAQVAKSFQQSQPRTTLQR